MIRVSIEVDCGKASSTRLTVRAESIVRALKVVGKHNPGCALNVMFPLDPDTFFVRNDSERVEAGAAEIAA